MKSDYMALSGRVRQSLQDLVHVVDRSELMMKKARQSGDDCYLDGTALNLHAFYTGIERILEDIARTVDNTVPRGPEWHRDLILQVAAEVSTVRPPVIGQATRFCLDEFRGFRHIVRNVYTFNLKSTRLKELTDKVRECYLDFEQDLIRFIAFLEQLTD